jgi:phospholipid N-methyltransferase
LFLRRFLASPGSVGAIAPSSRFLARKMLAPIRWEHGVRVVEFGPGTGSFTGEILQRLPEPGGYLGIERDRAFIDHLRRRFPGADFHCGRVEDLRSILGARGWPAVDHIISGLPFASLSAEVTRDVIDAAAAALVPGGTFTTFQYLHAYWLRPARTFRGEMARRFRPRRVTGVELRNLPPAFVFTWSTR